MAIRCWKPFVRYLFVSIKTEQKLSYRRDSVRCMKRPFEVTQGHALLFHPVGTDFFVFLVTAFKNTGMKAA